MKRFFPAFLICLIYFGSFAQTSDWRTFYEKSGETETPRCNQTIAFCRQLANASSKVHYLGFGTSGQGRELPLLIVDKDGLADPEKIRAKGRIILMLQACIHPGECEGKDAGLMLVRDLVISSKQLKEEKPGYHSKPDPSLATLLEKVSILFIPIFNVDGHERFGPYNRINQNGPKEMGWRVNACNLNLNRDYLKAETPEMQAWLKLFNRWMPEFFIDSHTTDGADYQYVLTYGMEIFGDMDKGLTVWTKETFIPGLEERLFKQGYPVFPYVNFRRWHDPKSGLTTGVSPPMLSQGYTSLRNRPGLLIETHMLKPYNQRVESTYECVIAALRILQTEGAKLRNLEKEADRFLISGDYLKSPFPLQFESSPRDSVMTRFLGVEYTKVKSGISGGDWFQYSNTPATFNLPYYCVIGPGLTVVPPLAYIIPVEWKGIVHTAELHGLQIFLTKNDTTIPVSSCRFKNPKWQQNPYEGHHMLTNIEYDEISENRLIPAGSAIIPLTQQSGRILLHLLEPKGNGSLVYWGFFDAVFEQKEYAENYVLEQLAVKMLSENPTLKKELDDKKAGDTAFARSPQQILNWFYARSPYFDRSKGLYPVVKIYDRKVLEALTGKN